MRDLTIFEQRVWGVCLVVGQALMTLSTFFWQGHGYSVNVGTLIVLACVFWIPGMMGLFQLIKPRWPRLATLGLPLAIYGCVGGALFGFEGMYTALFAIPHESAMAAWAQSPLQFNLTIFWPGPLFPLTLLVLGLIYLYTKTTPAWVALLLAAGGIAFPLSRILRIEWIAHVADLLLFVPVLYLGFQLLTRKIADDEMREVTPG